MGASLIASLLSWGHFPGVTVLGLVRKARFDGLRTADGFNGPVPQRRAELLGLGPQAWNAGPLIVHGSARCWSPMSSKLHPLAPFLWRDGDCSGSQRILTTLQTREPPMQLRRRRSVGYIAAVVCARAGQAAAKKARCTFLKIGSKKKKPSLQRWSQNEARARTLRPWRTFGAPLQRKPNSN